MKNPDHIVALDLGSDRIKAAAAEVLPNGKINVLGLIALPSEGIKKGSVINMDTAAKTIEQTLLNLEKLSGVEISRFVIGFSGISIETVRNLTSVTVGQDHKIRTEDRERALFSAQNIIRNPEQSVLQVLENKYSIDGNDGIRDPIGMTGQRLGLDALVILFNTSARDNLMRSVEQISLPADMIYNPIMLAESTLTITEREVGVVLVDMGSDITEVSIFQNGGMIRSFVLPVGAENITRDLSLVLKISLEAAKNIKETGRFLSLQEKDFTCTIKNLQGKEEVVSSEYICRIIIARLDEMAQMIWDEISQCVLPQWLPGGMVLTGGGAKLDGIVPYYGQLFGFPVRFGEIIQVEGLYEEYNQPEYAAVLGNLLFQRLHTENSNNRFGFKVHKVVKTVQEWMKDFLG